MTEIQKHILVLMKEIDQVCREQRIRYILHGQTAGCALKYGKFKTGAYPFHIILSEKDIDQLTAGLKALGIQNRELETPKENPDMGMNIVRYVDSGTAIFDRKEAASYLCNGAAVTIHPFREVYGQSSSSVLVKKLAGVLKLKKSYRLETGEGKYKDFPAECLTETRRIPFEGMELPVPENSDRFFRCFYGKDWKKLYAQQMQSTNSSFVIYDAHISYKQYLKDFESVSVDIRELFGKIRSLNQFLDTEYSEKKENMHRNWMIAKRSEDKVALSHAYADKMDDLRKLADGHHTEQLKNEMKPYLEKEDFYLSQGLQFSVNDELQKFADQIRRAEASSQ